MQIPEGVAHLGIRPCWITPSLICITQPHSLIANLFGSGHLLGHLQYYNIKCCCYKLLLQGSPIITSLVFKDISTHMGLSLEGSLPLVTFLTSAATSG